MLSTVWSVSFFRFFYSCGPRVQPFVSGGAVPAFLRANTVRHFRIFSLFTNSVTDSYSCKQPNAMVKVS